MEPTIIIKLLETLIKVIKKLFKKKELKDNCKKAGELISDAIRELMKIMPNLNTVKTKILEAEKLCELQEDLIFAKSLLAEVELSAAKIARAKMVAQKKLTAKRAAAAKKKAKSAKAVVKRRTMVKKASKK